ncbi:MAG: histidine phosphatase family protein [Bacteroidota bacterium]
MKNLFLMRHGKSSWEYNVADRNRPLNERGIGDAILVGNHLHTMGISVERVYSSMANRALHTSIIVMEKLTFDLNNFQVRKDLYDFSGEQVDYFVKGLDNSFENVMIFGHNHAFTELANRWGDTYIDNVPTAGCVHLQFDVASWSELQKGTTKRTIFPKLLKIK